MDSFINKLKANWLVAALVGFAVIYWAAFFIFRGKPDALLVVTFVALVCAVAALNHEKAKLRRNENHLNDLRNMRETTSKAFVEERASNAAIITSLRALVAGKDSLLEKQGRYLSQYRVWLLKWLAASFPSGTRLEHFDEAGMSSSISYLSSMGIYPTGKEESTRRFDNLHVYLYVDLPATLGLENRQLRFLLSEEEEKIFEDLPTYEGERVTILPGESGDILNEFVTKVKPATEPAPEAPIVSATAEGPIAPPAISHARRRRAKPKPNK